MKYLIALLTRLTEDEQDVCAKIYSLEPMNVITSYIRFFDNDIRIYAINLMINVLSQVSSNLINEPMVIWSISILVTLIKEETEMKNKIRAVDILCKQAHFKNYSYDK